MNVENIKLNIIKELKNIKVIDTHEHMLPPEFHQDMNYSFFDLMIPYVQYDLVSAGMSKDFFWKNNLTNNEVERCYSQFKNYWKFVEHGSYAMHVKRVLKENFDIDNITDENYQQIGVLLNQTRNKEHYKKVIYDECNIKFILNQAGDYFNYSQENDYFLSHADVLKNGVIEDIKFLKTKIENSSIDDLLEMLCQRIIIAKNKGAKLVKYDASCFIGDFDEKEAKLQFDKLKNGENCDSQYLQKFLYESTLKVVKENQLVAAIHTGVWDNFYRKSPQHIVQTIQNHPEINFDVYHMGFPFSRECGFLGKNFNNVYLNLCWAHIVSPRMLKNTLLEWLDFVPVNKIFAFGGDHTTLPINIKTHLNFAKENLAEVFAEKIYKNELTFDQSLTILNMWFYKNPKEVYKL